MPVLTGLGIFSGIFGLGTNGIIGQIGSQGGLTTGSAGTAVNPWPANGWCGSAGSGGGGCNTSNADFAGGNINGGIAIPPLQQAINGGAAGGGRGADGFELHQPCWGFFGGTGGGSFAAGTGGAGGNGATGCGGGGGGGGINGGAGGNGGNGLAVITCW